MSLTGVPLLVLASAGTVATGVATAWLWPRRRWARPVAVLLLEVLAVSTAGLAFNRYGEFYPSWRALAGDTGTVVAAAPVPAGRLDGTLTGGPVPWRPAGLAAWRLARVPTLTVPAGYRTRPGVLFPVVLTLGAAAPRTADAVVLILAPTAGTTAAALRDLPAELRRDVRVTAGGWDVLGGDLAAGFVRAAPPGLAVLNRPVDSLPPALAPPMLLPTS